MEKRYHSARRHMPMDRLALSLSATFKTVDESFKDSEFHHAIGTLVESFGVEIDRSELVSITSAYLQSNDATALLEVVSAI